MDALAPREPGATASELYALLDLAWEVHVEGAITITTPARASLREGAPATT